MPCAVPTVPEAAAADVGPGPDVKRQMGDPSGRNQADPTPGPRELRRSVLRQVAGHHRSGCENVAGRHHVDGGLPAGGEHHEEVPAQTIGRLVRSVQQGRADLHRAGVHVQRELARLPAQRRGQSAGVRGLDLHRVPSGVRHGVLREQAADPSRFGGQERADRREQHREDLRLRAGEGHRGQRVLPEARVAVPREMDGAGSDHLRQVLDQVRRVVVRCAADGAVHIRTSAVSRYARAGGGRSGRERVQDAETHHALHTGRHL